MKYYLTVIRFFLQEIGRQDALLLGSEPHWYKTRTGFRSAWIYARLRADIKFDRL